MPFQTLPTGSNTVPAALRTGASTSPAAPRAASIGPLPRWSMVIKVSEVSTSRTSVKRRGPLKRGAIGS